MRSIKTKLIAIYAAVVLVVMTVSGTFMLWTVRSMEIGQTHNALANHARLINETIVQIYENFWDAAWPAPGQAEYEIEGAILTDLGTAIAPPRFAGMRFNDISLSSAMAGSEFFNVGSLGVDLHGHEHQWFTFAMPVANAYGNFIVYTRVNMRFMNERLSGLTFTFVLTVLIALVVTMVFWLFLGSTIANPIVALTKHARAIAAGDFSRKIKVVSRDEIGELSLNFNNMAQELRANISNIASERNKLEVFLQNTTHGVLAYDAEGKLLHANNACGELLHGMDYSNTDVRYALTRLGFDVKEVSEMRPGDVRESVYEHDDYSIMASVTPYTSETDNVEGYVIVLQDITRQIKLDNMRKEFVANVSHELRTPLTNIRTYSETLLDGALDDKETATRFLKIIDEESQRMTLLVSDLLELSRIDSKHAALEMEVLDLVAIIRLAIRQAEILSVQKKQKIEFEPPKGACFTEANATRINQVIYNILSNSIKYSPEDTTISILIESSEKFYRVFIQDQGMGIPTESINRVFERFYRVDKARARALGGTGLGLAIVKEIMEEHGGRVYASSQPGQGTTMVLRFNRLLE
ncbi:MAG: cell wall metabolism sensor histidine kinase WalK [Defluviitaleaceae bacterium]|nr:cell wall metabolism sensor histidine kinase WalK [Defluviitaleaceae bacterium]